MSPDKATAEPPEPWRSFLRELDARLTGQVLSRSDLWPRSPIPRHVLDQRLQARRPLPGRRLLPLHVDPERQLLAEFHPELIEGVDAPDRALNEHAMLVQGNE